MADDNQNNVLSQEEIDKLSGMSEESTDSNKDENIDISTMLSQDEINQVAGNLNELNEQNNMNNSVPEKKNEDKAAESSDSSNSLLSQEEIDKLSGTDLHEIDEAINNPELKEKTSDEEINSEIDEQEFPELQEGKDSKSKSSPEIKKKSKKKLILISGSIITVIILFIIGYFIIGKSTLEGPEVLKEIEDKKSEFLPDKKKKNNVDLKKTEKKLFADKKTDKENFRKSQIDKVINKGVDLFFDQYKNNKMEGVILKSEELIVEHDMDITERNLQLCLSFDLTASLIDTTLSKKNNNIPNNYFNLEKLNNRYKKRVMNLGYSSEEADDLILNWGKKIIKKIKEKTNKDKTLIKK